MRGQMAGYDPFAHGPYDVGVGTIEIVDTRRRRVFPCEIWSPQAAGPQKFPLIVFSHGSGSLNRRMATFLCTHLASHGYIVAAMDHSEVVAVELARRERETSQEKMARVEGMI